MITEIASVVGGCVFAGGNDDLRHAIFSLKIPAAKPAAWRLNQQNQISSKLASVASTSSHGAAQAQ